MLSVYDTSSREKRPFQPVNPQRVTLYVCGPTVYDYAHIGNARPAVVFDVLFRLLRRLYGEAHVVYARNVTDVDDRINAKALKEGVPIGTVTARYEAAYEEDMAALGVLTPTFRPHVTSHIEPIVDQIAAILARGHAYVAEGHVLFDVNSFGDYGALSRRSLDDMIAGARIDVAPYKKNPADFVLWKPGKPGDPVWPSPWGEGRPGWHIECSAMIERNLGMPIDIHGGGHDLIFPHHENEQAQGRCAHGGEVYARYWMHNGMLNMGAEKMSKSLGNVLLLHELVKLAPGEVVRWALLSAHYRAPLDWTDAVLDQSREALDRFHQSLIDARRAGLDEARLASDDMIERGTAAFFEALHDDLNTPGAFAKLFVLYREFREALTAFEQKTGSADEARVRRDVFLHAARTIGFLEGDPEAWFNGRVSAADRERIEALVAARSAAKAARDWAEADRIRDELAKLGVEVMDGPKGTTWRLREG